MNQQSGFLPDNEGQKEIYNKRGDNESDTYDFYLFFANVLHKTLQLTP